MKNEKKVTASEVIEEREQAKRNEKYNAYVKNMTPTHNVAMNVLKAFFVGGIICTIGQGITNFYKIWFDQEVAILYQVITMVLIAVVLTGLNIYPKIAKFGGAGTVVPITGFANGVAASAIEFKKEGQVFGIGCRIFSIAGPVILYGIFSSWVLGFIYWLFQKF